MPLPGIRLSDLYSSEDYNNWMKDSTNVKLVNNTIQEYRDENPQMIKGHLYMNSKIKSSIGEQAFGDLPEDMTLQEKVDWYNNNIANKGSSETGEPEFEDITAQRDSSTIPLDTMQVTPHESIDPGEKLIPPAGTTLRDWFKQSAGGDYTGYVEAEKERRRKEREEVEEIPENIEFSGIFQGPKYKSERTQQLEDELSVLKDTNPNNSVAIRLKENEIRLSRQADNKLYSDAFGEIDDEVKLREDVTRGSDFYSPIARNKWDTEEAQIKLNSLTDDLRDRFDADATETFDYFKRFEDEMIKNVPQYRNYHDSNMMPFSPDEMKSIMAEYYAIKELKDSNEATNFASAIFQNRLASQQSILDKVPIAFKQGGANIAGNTVAFVGLLANSLDGFYRAVKEDTDIEDVSFWKEWLYYSADNPLTQWGNRASTTGVWLPSLQEAFEQSQYNSAELFRKAGQETNILDVNTPFDLFAQAGFTVAGMATGGATAQILSKTVGKQATRLATQMLAKEGAGWGSRAAAWSINTLGKELVTVTSAYLPAAAEASMDALETYNKSKEQAEEAIAMGMEAQLAREYEDGTYDMWYQQNSRIPYTLDPEHPLTEEQQQQLAELRAQEREYLWGTYQSLRHKELLNDPEVQQNIEMAAKRAAAKNMFDETMWIALGDYTISNALGKTFKAVKEGGRRALLGTPEHKFRWVAEGGHYRPVAKEISFMDKVKAVGGGVLEGVEEGVEEWFQTVDTQMRQDLNKDYIAQYIKNRYDPDSAATLTDSMFKNWKVAKASLGENIFSDEAIYSFWIGALSSVAGSPTGMRGLRTRADVLAKTGDKKAANKAMWKASWRNPIAERWNDLKTQYKQEQLEAADINRWMDAHPEVDSLNDEGAIISFMAQQEKAVREGDEATYRDAVMGQRIATMLMMEKTNPSGAKQNFYARIKELSKLSPSDPQARDVLKQVLSLREDSTTPRTVEGPLNEEESAIIQDVAKKAKDMLNTYKNLTLEISILDSQFGNSISTETKEALAYSLIMQKDWGRRVGEITDSAIKAFNEANPDAPVTPISSDKLAGMNALAKYGSKEAADAELAQLLKERNALRARRKSMYKYEYKTQFEKNQKAIKENRAAARALSTLEEDALITAEEILSLSSRERAYLLDPANRKRYSEKQQAEIERFVSSEGIRGDMVTDLIDAGRLQNRMDYFKTEYDVLTRNNGALVPVFDREVRKEAAKTWTKAKLGTAMEATTYEEFKEAMDQSIRAAEFSDMDRMAMSEIFNEEEVGKQTWEFYERYKKEEATRRSIRSIIENSPEFQNLKEEEKQLVEVAVEDAQRDNDEVTAESIIKKLVDPEYVSKLEQQGIDVAPLRTSVEELAGAIEKVMQQKKHYDENFKALKEAAEAKRRAKQEKDEEGKPLPEPGDTPKPQGRENTIIPRDKYERGKDKYNGIFKKIADNFGRKSPQKLTTDEYLSFVSLYTEEPIAGGLVTDDFDHSLTESGIYNAIETLDKVLENRLYTDENASEAEDVKNTIALLANLRNLLGLMEQARMQGTNASVEEYFKNSILQLNPELGKVFDADKSTKIRPNIGEVNSKVEGALTTKTEKEWYEKNHITENLETLMGLGASTVDLVFLKDSELARKLQEEKGAELTDDDIPLILAARVPLKTKGAIKSEDGYTYLYVGLLQDSRRLPEAEARNAMNDIRTVAMEQEKDGAIIYQGKPYVANRVVPKRPSTTSDKTETTSFKSFLLDRHKDKKGKEQEKAAIEDFIKNYRRIKLITKDGVTSGEFTVEVKKPDGTTETKRFPISWDTTAPDDLEGRTAGAYIRDNGDGTYTPLFLEVRGIDEIMFDDTHSIYDALNDVKIDITDPKYEKHNGNYVRKSVVAIRDKILDKAKELQSKRARVQAIEELTGTSEKVGTIQAIVQKYLNLSKPAGLKRGRVSIGVTVENEVLKLICWATGTEDEKAQAFDIPQVLSEMPISALDGNPGKVAEAVSRFAQDGIKNLIFDENGEIRKADTSKDGSGKMWPIIKFEDNQAKNDEEIETVFDRGDITLKILGDIFQVRTYAIKQAPESVTAEVAPQAPQVQVATGGQNAQQLAIQRITAPEYIDEHEGEHFETGPNEMEVTTFIKGGAEDVDWGEKSLAGKLATNLGTSVDKLYRVWRRGRSPEAVAAYMKERGIGSWPGLSRTEGLPEMLEQFKRIDKFFEERGEVQIDDDLIFNGVVRSGDKTTTLIGKPDIITVDKDGRYHIYDMKSFRYQQGAIAKVPGFRSTFFTINGKKNAEKDMEKWRKQLSMYKALIESKFGPNTVSTHLGIIPIRLGYQVEGSIEPYVHPGIGAHKINDRLGKPMHLSFNAAPSELSPSKKHEPITRCFDDVIQLNSIDKIEDINPEGWRMISKADDYKMELEKAKRTGQPEIKLESDEEDLLKDVKLGTDGKIAVQPGEGKVAQPVPNVEVQGPITIGKPIAEMTGTEIGSMIKGEEISEDEEDQLLARSACKTKKK